MFGTNRRGQQISLRPATRPDGLRKESIDVLPDFSEEMCVPLLMSGDMPIQDKFAYRDMLTAGLLTTITTIAAGAASVVITFSPPSPSLPASRISR
ncbi:hypothetical protein C0Q70_14323 [Pomacea canaliculata]|uniref:Uncharacterized protein n=1 Tax=Pomacea canaliculata TaxID=400727 RepID=A0A2T7NZQ4_POMCA|nr:hypothetical protein C0Q70_14323 [Pomacea canaliculata]